MDSRLLTLLPAEQARCREIARHYSAMGSIGCFAAALIEQALQRADRAIIEGGEDSIRSVLHELQAFDMARQPAAGLSQADLPRPSPARLALAVPPVGRHLGRMAAPAFAAY